MIELHQCSRWYGQVIGINDVTCSIGPGITALIGQNGAGKSTMMRLVTGQIRPTTGDVLVHGETPFGNPHVFKHLGYCPEIDNFYEHQTGRQFLVHMARLSGFAPADAKDRANQMLGEVGMLDRCDRAIAGYSKGMRQRIKLAQAMLHDPDIILLDEPLNGLDPLGRHEFMNYLGYQADRGKAIIVSSHILFELEQLTRSILLLHRGRLLAGGNLREIRELIDKHPHHIRIETPAPRKVAQELMGIEGILSAAVLDSDLLELTVKSAEHFYSDFAAIAREKSLPIRGFSSPDNNMEAVFRYLVEG